MTNSTFEKAFAKLIIKGYDIEAVPNCSYLWEAEINGEHMTLTEEQIIALAESAKEADTMNETTNNKELAIMERGELVKAAIEKAKTEKAQGYRIEDNAQFKSKEIYFDGIPSVKTRDNLKALKFRWHGQKKCWYGFATNEQIAEACGDILRIPEVKAVDPGTLYAGWEGGKARTWHSEQELKKFILDDCKKVGIKASIRFKRAGYLTAFIMTVTIKPEHIKSFEEFKKNFNINRQHFSGWLQYEESFEGRSTTKDIHIEKFLAMPEGEEKQNLLERIIRKAYDNAVQSLTCNSNRFYDDGCEILTAEGNEIFKTVHDIVASYNRDCSNSMIDYFDRDIYDDYAFKVVA